MNLGKALSQTLVMLTIEAVIPADVVSQAIVGIGDLNNINVKDGLVSSIDSSFRFFTIFFIVALVLGFILLYSKESNRLKDVELEFKKKLDNLNEG
jgi:hypothetical protein